MPLLHINGVETHYHIHGRGTPLVFLHPPCMGSRVFTYLNNDLSRDHRSLLFDIRGHGRTMSSPAPLNFRTIVEDLCGLMDALALPSAYLCAYGLASMPALHALEARPDRFLGGILLSGAAEIIDPIARMRLRAAQLTGALRGKELLSFPLLWQHADNHEAFYNLRRESEGGDVKKWREYLAATLQGISLPRLTHIHQPVLLVYGGRDTHARKEGSELLQGLKQASFAIVPDAPRTLPMHAASESGRIIREWMSGLHAEVGASEAKAFQSLTPILTAADPSEHPAQT